MVLEFVFCTEFREGNGLGNWILDFEFGNILSNWDFRLELFQSPSKDNGIVIIPEGRHKLGVYTTVIKTDLIVSVNQVEERSVEF